MNQAWWHSAVVYQIYPRSFLDTTGSGSGDLAGIISKLDYLAKLGVDLIWLSPVYRSPMQDNGYDIADYQDIDPSFGSLNDMQRLIDEAKQRNIGIMMDLVINHTSSEHPWFKQAKQSRDNPYRNYYIWRDQENEISSIFGGKAWTWDEHSQQYYFHLFADGQPDLNWDNPALEHEIHKMINWWLDRGVAGFRLDVIDLIGKQVDRGITSNGPHLHPLLQRMNQASFGNKEVVTVGETWGATPEIAKLYSQPERQELSMIFQFEHASIDWHPQHGKWLPQRFNLVELKKILSKWQTELNTGGWNALFWNNHDLPRIVSRWANDNIYRERSAKMLAMVLHGMRGTPYIYQGEELGMTNITLDKLSDYQDIEIHNAYQDIVLDKQQLSHQQFMQGVYQNGRDNARTPMQWDQQANAGFSCSPPWLPVNPNYTFINAEQALAQPDSIFYCYQQLIALRKDVRYAATLIYGDYQPLDLEHPQLFAYLRQHQQQSLLLVANWSEQGCSIHLSDVIHSVSEILVSNLPLNLSQLDKLCLELAPYQAMLLAVERA